MYLHVNLTLVKFQLLQDFSGHLNALFEHWYNINTTHDDFPFDEHWSWPGFFHLPPKTWQDTMGFHVFLPDIDSAGVSKL